jgi:hypothetical protein
VNWFPRDGLGRFHKPGDPVKPGKPGKQRRPHRRVQVPISCHECGRVFIANRRDARYCSDLCRKNASNHRLADKMTEGEAAALARLRQIDPAVNEFLNGVDHRWGKQGLKRAVHAMIKVAEAAKAAQARAVQSK